MLTREVAILPFLKTKKEGGVSTPIEKNFSQPKSLESNDNDGLLAVAYDLLKGIEAKDTAAIAAAFRAGFQILELEPHDEISHNDQGE